MNLSAEQIAGLVGSLVVLVVWIAALRNQRAWNRDQKQRREPKKPDEAPPPPSGEGRGPWG